MPGWCALLLVVGLGACGSANAPNPDGGLCGVCPTGEGCNVATKACAPANPEGVRCGADAPTGTPTICQDGLSCGPIVGGTNLCTKACKGASDCGSSESCYLVQLDGGNRQYCATPVPVGSTCGSDQLRQCSSGNGVVAACIEGSDGGGQCMQRCSAQVGCPSGQACTTPFSDGEGVCGTPTEPGSGCDETALQFCTAGQVCVVEAGTRGTCHLTCTPGAATTGCSGTEICIYADPCATSGQGFCVTPQPVDGGCAPADDHFCGPDADCVNLAGTLLCKPDCTTSNSCYAGTCNALPQSCRSACF
ncbi:MAG: hypothetical protein JST54_07440 [Deltaproteobacteria bacterium]|nr:hypothetical protein [Deltaproteobacteria bacterium]